MIERSYDPQSGGVVSDQRTGMDAARAMPPADMPAPDAARPSEPFRNQGYGEWQPGNVSDDPHDQVFDKVSGYEPLRGPGPVPPNIGDGSHPGPFTSVPPPLWLAPKPAGEPHDVPFG